MVRSVRQNSSTLGTMIFILWGVIVWFLHLSAIYLAHTLLCALETRPTLIMTVIVWATVVALAAIAPIIIAPQRVANLTRLPRSNADGHHVVSIARFVAVLSLVAVLWSGATMVFVDSCELLR